MRITFVLPPVNMSGGLKVVAIHAKALSELGHQVTLVSPPHPAIPWRGKLESLLKGRGWPVIAGAASHLDGLGLAHRVTERFRPISDADVPDADVVIATWWETAEWVNALDPRKGAKVYFIQHHEIFDYLPVARCKNTYRLPMHKVVIARWLADVMRDEYGDASSDIVPNAVDHAQFFAPTRGKQARPTLGFLYHETHFKGVDVTLEALARLRKRHPDLRVICFGSKRPSGQFPFEDAYEFHLNPPQDQIRGLYAQCDAWLTASRSEGFNLPAMEAMACRTPVVATRTGWPAEAIVEGRNGRLVEVDDVDGLARGAEAFLAMTDAAWREASECAFETVASSTWQASARLFEAALMQACQRAGRGEIAGECASLTTTASPSIHGHASLNLEARA